MNATQAKALVDFKAYCESCFPVGPSTDDRLSVTGEEYVQFNPMNGERGTFESPQDAIAAAKVLFDEYSANRCGALYWRVEPEIRYFHCQKPSRGSCYRCSPGWMIYFRLLISNEPAKEI